MRIKCSTACLAVMTAMMPLSLLWAGNAVTGTVLRNSLVRVGMLSAGAAPDSPTATALGPETRNGPDQDREFQKQIRGSIAPARVPASGVPKTLDKQVHQGSSTGFDGISHLEQRLADNQNQFSLEPPDQALAVGGGYIVEAVNLGIRTRRTDGTPLGPVRSLNRFFGLPSTIARGGSVPIYGPFTSDPKAYYDAQLQRFFVTTLEIDVDPLTGAFLPHSSVMIAVSANSDPTGAWHVYSLDTTNPSHPGCPCFGDQPLIGADANGLYISTNEFPLFTSGFNGAQVYAMSKSILAAGGMPAVVLLSPGALEEGPAYSLQPATTPPGGSFAWATEYFMSALDFTGTLDNRVAVWALTGTDTLASATPVLSLRHAIVASQVYGQPPAMQQKDGPLPLADMIRAGDFGKPATEHLPLIDSNDDRMQQTIYVNGRLWCALNTVVQPKHGPVRTGIAWFIVEPSSVGGTLTGTMVNQGYLSVDGQNVTYPSVAINNSNRGIIGFTLVGPDYFPSAAYVTVNAAGTSDVQIAQAGKAPDDGFSGYVAFGSRVGRWGDYSAAVADEQGNLWFATEYIPSGLRAVLANWGTFIAKVPN